MCLVVSVRKTPIFRLGMSRSNEIKTMYQYKKNMTYTSYKQPKMHEPKRENYLKIILMNSSAKIYIIK